MIIAITNDEMGGIHISISKPANINDLDSNVENITQLTDELTGIYYAIYELYDEIILFEILDEAIKKWQERRIQ